MTRLFTIAALLLLAVPAAFAAPPAGQGSSASKACKEQRKAVGMNAFRLQYAPTGSPKAAMAACLAQQVQLVTTEAKNAAKACRAERAQSLTAFNQKYGNKRNAFGKCVSSTTAEEVEEQQQDVLNAAKACKSERGTTAQSIAAFNTEHGTNPNKRNAFGKCVSKLANAKSS
ncbi:MAG: hypothetical protein ACRDNY_04175 [Gaiellaceae bacterium]